MDSIRPSKDTRDAIRSDIITAYPSERGHINIYGIGTPHGRRGRAARAAAARDLERDEAVVLRLLARAGKYRCASGTCGPARTPPLAPSSAAAPFPLPCSTPSRAPPHPRHPPPSLTPPSLRPSFAPPVPRYPPILLPPSFAPLALATPYLDPHLPPDRSPLIYSLRA